MDKGFAEMGFGRFGGAVPLGEAISLVAFDVCVPEVLKNLRAARQPSDSREVCAESKSREKCCISLSSGSQHASITAR